MNWISILSHIDHGTVVKWTRACESPKHCSNTTGREHACARAPPLHSTKTWLTADHTSMTATCQNSITVHPSPRAASHHAPHPNPLTFFQGEIAKSLVWSCLCGRVRWRAVPPCCWSDAAGAAPLCLWEQVSLGAWNQSGRSVSMYGERQAGVGGWTESTRRQWTGQERGAVLKGNPLSATLAKGLYTMLSSLFSLRLKTWALCFFSVSLFSLSVTA